MAPIGVAHWAPPLRTQSGWREGGARLVGVAKMGGRLSLRPSERARRSVARTAGSASARLPASIPAARQYPGCPPVSRRGTGFCQSKPPVLTDFFSWIQMRPRAGLR